MDFLLCCLDNNSALGIHSILRFKICHTVTSCHLAAILKLSQNIAVHYLTNLHKIWSHAIIWNNYKITYETEALSRCRQGMNWFRIWNAARERIVLF